MYGRRVSVDFRQLCLTLAEKYNLPVEVVESLIKDLDIHLSQIKTYAMFNMN